MFRKIILCILVFSLILALLPGAVAADWDDLYQSVENTYDTYASSIYQKSAADNGLDQLLEHSIKGNRKPLHMDQDDPFTSALFQTVLFRKGMIDILSRALGQMSGSGSSSMVLAAVFSWHDYGVYYSAFQCRDDEVYDNEKKARVSTICPKTDLSESTNRADSTMMLVVGGAECFTRITRTACTPEAITYQVDLLVHDNFAFDSNYSSFDEKGFSTTFSKLLCALGPLLGLKEYSWTSTAAFTVTIPNPCDHTLISSRWVMGTDLVCDSTESPIPLTRFNVTNDTGAVTGSYYQMDRSVRLLHNQLWAVEFRMKGSANFYLPFNANGSSANFALFRYSNFMCANRSQFRERTDPETGQIILESYADRAGIEYDNALLKEMHTYRVENRIEPDGSNMLWLLIDGIEQGPLTTHWFRNYDAQTGKYEYVFTQEPTYDLCGQDLIINYIFSTGSPLQRPDSFEWVAIWESTDPTATLLSPSYTAPACISSGNICEICSICGAVSNFTEIPALGHKPMSVPGQAPSCEAEGITEGSLCSVCGEVLEKQEPIPSLEHSPLPVPGKAPTCTETGLTEGFLCAVCDEILKTQEVLPALGHRFEKGRCTCCGDSDPDWLPGDADGNGILNYSDALIILRSSIGL